jgi:cytochrome c oxidase subunit 3
MAEVGVQYADRERQDQAAHFGLLVFLGSESLLFAGLLGIYAGVWAEHGSAFTAGASHNLGWFGLAGTIILLCSSAAVATAVATIERGHGQVARWLLLLAMLLGTAFLVGKGYEYHDHIAQGMLPGGRGEFFLQHPEPALVAFANLYWLTTGLHAAHLLLGLVLLALGVVICRRGRAAAAQVELVALYWHFVDLVWLFLWPLFYSVGSGA